MMTHSTRLMNVTVSQTNAIFRLPCIIQLFVITGILYFSEKVFCSVEEWGLPCPDRGREIIPTYNT
jgi:hypothetical protein